MFDPFLSYTKNLQDFIVFIVTCLHCFTIIAGKITNKKHYPPSPSQKKKWKKKKNNSTSTWTPLLGPGPLTSNPRLSHLLIPVNVEAPRICWARVPPASRDARRCPPKNPAGHGARSAIGNEGHHGGLEGIGSSQIVSSWTLTLSGPYCKLPFLGFFGFGLSS